MSYFLFALCNIIWMCFPVNCKGVSAQGFVWKLLLIDLFGCSIYDDYCMLPPDPVGKEYR